MYEVGLVGSTNTQTHISAHIHTHTQNTDYQVTQIPRESRERRVYKVLNHQSRVTGPLCPSSFTWLLCLCPLLQNRRLSVGPPDRVGVGGRGWSLSISPLVSRNHTLLVSLNRSLQSEGRCAHDYPVSPSIKI